MQLAALAGGLLLWLAESIDPVLRRRLLTAGVVFFAGVVGMEVVGGLPEAHTIGFDGFAQSAVLHVSILIEESLETTGAIIALCAALSYLHVVKAPDGFRVTVGE